MSLVALYKTTAAGPSRNVLVLALSMQAIALAQGPADSAFVEGAFNGTWNVTSATQLTDTIVFAPIAAANGPNLINSLGEPTFNATYCPGAAQKREYYSATLAGGIGYACTNGNSLFGRYAIGNEQGYFEITTATPGSNPSWSGQYLPPNTGGNFRAWSAVYVGGGIATPLARSTADVVRFLTVSPAASQPLPVGSRQDFIALVESKNNSTATAQLRVVLLDAQGTPLRVSDTETVDLIDPLRQDEFRIADVTIPAASIRLRAELRAPNGSVLASAEIAYQMNTTASSLTVSPRRLRFAALAPSPGTFTQTLLVEKTGTGASLTFEARRVGSSLWIAQVTAAGEARNNAPVFVEVTVNTAGLAAGGYNDAVRITPAQGAAIDIPVTLTVSEQGAVLSLGNTGLRFEVRQGQGNSVTRNVRVRNVGTAGSALSWTARVVRGPDVLTLTPAVATSTVGNPANLAVTLRPNGTDTLGANYALIEVADPNAINSPQYIAVVVDVSGSNTPTVPLPSPAGFFFSAAAGGAAPPAQALVVNVSRSTPANFTASVVTTEGVPWLRVSPAQGTASSAAPGQVSVTADVADLDPGVYEGLVNITIGPTVRSSKVILIVQPPAAPDARAAHGCTPARVVIVETSLFANFAVPAGYPATLVARVLDDCGHALPDASVVASFSNGDPPLTLLGDNVTNDYAATWAPGVVDAATVVRIVATSGMLAPATYEIRGGVNTNTTPPPSLAAAGILHNVNAVLGAPLAPGTVAQIYGTDLAAVTAAAPVTPLPTSLQGVEMLIGAASAPLYFVSANQLVVQLPTTLAANRTYSALVSVNGQLSLPEPVDVVAVQPGTYILNGRLLAQHLDFTFVTPQSPAKPGEILVMYLVGMGAVDPAVASGEVSPANPPAQVRTQPAITVDGQSAAVLFAGLTPGFVGLYQINFTVPPGARAGDLEVVITQAGVEANRTRLPVAGP